MNEDNNMRVWDRVCKTDPGHTKNVSYGKRKFTAVDAQYQIRSATEIFGPIGAGWGYDCEHETLVTDDFILAITDLTLWYREGEQTHSYGPIRTMATLWTSRGGRIDEDAWKKATTDGLTKTLSQLGFNADVFLGLFDDVRYVQEARKHAERQESSPYVDGLRAAFADNDELGWRQLFDELKQDQSLFLKVCVETLREAFAHNDEFKGKRIIEELKQDRPLLERVWSELVDEEKAVVKKWAMREAA